MQKELHICGQQKPDANLNWDDGDCVREEEGEEEDEGKNQLQEIEVEVILCRAKQLAEGVLF